MNEKLDPKVPGKVLFLTVKEKENTLCLQIGELGI